MRIKEGFVLRTIQNNHVVIGEGVDQVNFNKMLNLNGPAAYLWEKAVGKDFTTRELVDYLLERYDVSEDIALEDSTTWVETLKAQAIIEE